MSNSIQDEVDANHEAFVKLLPSLLATHRDQYALLKNRKVLGYYSNAVDARTAAEAFISDKLYSIQRVTDTSVDLGYFSHAVHLSPVQPGSGSPASTGHPENARNLTNKIARGTFTAGFLLECLHVIGCTSVRLDDLILAVESV